jgi:hypothetical protein
MIVKGTELVLTKTLSPSPLSETEDSPFKEGSIVVVDVVVSQFCVRAYLKDNPSQYSVLLFDEFSEDIPLDSVASEPVST